MVAINEAIRHYQQGMGRMTAASPGMTLGQNHGAGDFMRKNNNPYQQYQKNTINTASPQELTMMLYNGLVRFLKTAVQGIEEKDIEKANNFIIKSQNIITEFICTLDVSYEVSQGLLSLYGYMNEKLLEANLKKDKLIVLEVLGYAEELRNTWEEAMKLAKQQDVTP